MIERRSLSKQIQTALGRSRIVALTGPRQSGKTTLAQQFVAPDEVNYFDLEDLVNLARLDEPMTALGEQTYSAGEFEVIVVDPTSTDGTREYVQSLNTSFKLRLFERDRKY